MRTYSTAITNYLNSGKPYSEHVFFTFTVKHKVTNAPFVYNFSTLEANEDVTVENPDGEGPELRSFWGGGHIVDYDPIVLSAGTGIRIQRFRMSAVSDIVLDMVNGYNCTNAEFEWHTGIVDADTGLLVDNVQPREYAGFVDQISPSYTPIDPETGEPGEAVFEFEVASLFRALTATNPAVRSEEQGESRSGDKVFAYADAANTWQIYWGKNKSSHKQRNGGGDGKDDKPGKPNVPVRPDT